jgi:glycosyltransferase involved in cell wall biosynthesis
MNEAVHDGLNGMRFEPANPAALANVIRTLFSDPARLSNMRHGARREYEQRYTPEDNYAQLIHIYETAAASTSRSRRRADKAITQINTKHI